MEAERTRAAVATDRLRVTPARRLAFFLVVDTFLLVSSVLVATWLRFDGTTSPDALLVDLADAVGLAGVYVAAAFALGAYRAAWSFVGLRDIARISAATAIATSVAVVGTLALRGAGVTGTPSLAVTIIQAPISFCAISGFRLSKRAARLVLRGASVPQDVKKVLILGAGRAGEQVLKSILDSPGVEAFHVVGFLDDDPLARGTSIHGVRVLGPLSDLDAVLTATKTDVVIICIRNADRRLVQTVMRASRKAGVGKVRIVPTIAELVDGGVSLQTTRTVTMEDLLGRDPVDIDLVGVGAALRGRAVLVTGGAGTIGSELCRQLSRFEVGKLVVVDVDETRLHDLGLELAQSAPDVQVIQALVDVRDSAALEELFGTHDIRVVFHAAAYKHVPMMERWPLAALDVNVLGTANVLRAAQAGGAERFVLISTDKAVEPSSIMGASKRLAELVLFGTARRGLCVEAVRFGNVLGSRGSVLPIFEAQLKRGGPLTVTHRDVERYFMMTSEAVQLVLQASVMGTGHEVFVLDMGKPVRILDVAREFIRLNGLEPGKDIDIVFAGLRPGEKLSEILHYDHEQLEPTSHPRISQTTVHVAPQDQALVEAVRRIVEAKDQEAARSFFENAFPSLHAKQGPAPTEPWQQR